MYIRTFEGNRRGEVQDFPYSVAQELIKAGKASEVRFDDAGQEVKTASVTSEPAKNVGAAPPVQAKAAASRKPGRRIS